MHRFFGWILAGGIMVGSAATADAQVALSIGNPYTGTGITVGAPGLGYYGASPMYSGYAAAPLVGTTYSSGYAGYVAPSMGYYSSSYYGAYPMTSAYAYPYTGYGTGYGYGMYGVPSIYSPYGYRYGYGSAGWGLGRGGMLGGLLRRGW